jgi:hypothetical protein
VRSCRILAFIVEVFLGHVVLALNGLFPFVRMKILHSYSLREEAGQTYMGIMTKSATTYENCSF